MRCSLWGRPRLPFRSWPTGSTWLRAKHPDRVAVEGPSRSLTYAELSEAAVGVAGALQRMGVRDGDRVALALPAVEDFVVALHGCFLAGAVAVPVDLRLTEEERAMRMAGAKLVLTELPSPTTVSWPGTLFGDAPVTVMHTSGTTAAPKQVVLTRGNWLANALGSAVALGLDPAERWLCPMPLTHVGGLSIPIRSSIYATTAVVHGRFDTERVLGDLMDPARRITLVSLVPTMLSRLLDAGLARPPDAAMGAARGRPDLRGAARARVGRRGPGRAELWDDRDVLADRHVRVAAAGGGGACVLRRGGRAGPDGRGERFGFRRLAAHGRPGGASTIAGGL